ncbi:MAG: hypothetical protein KJ072_08195 [Verrucomicrobia bacterium]|nr:hypothetical protein [Verrucomicrobiota bacterium]
MKTIVNGLLQSRITRWVCFASLLAAVGLSVGWRNQRHYQLGGGWIGSGGGMTYSCLQIPLDPAGRTDAIRVKTTAYDAITAGLLAGFGADTLSDGVGEGRMISRDTSKWSMVGYAQVAGNPLQTTAILVYSGTWTFTSPDDAVINYSLTVYPPSASGLPENDPILTIPGMTGTVKRVLVP